VFGLLASGLGVVVGRGVVGWLGSAEAREFAAIVSGTDDAILSKGLDGTIQSWNPGAERLYGYSAAEAIGRHITLVVPGDGYFEVDEILGRIRAGERVEHYETVRERKDGTVLQVSVTASPIYDERVWWWARR
jgi:PAS domain S-box-containing protein